jgi:hypothetical protein
MSFLHRFNSGAISVIRHETPTTCSRTASKHKEVFKTVVKQPFRLREPARANHVTQR